MTIIRLPQQRDATRTSNREMMEIYRSAITSKIPSYFKMVLDSAIEKGKLDVGLDTDILSFVNDPEDFDYMPQTASLGRDQAEIFIQLMESTNRIVTCFLEWSLGKTIDFGKEPPLVTILPSPARDGRGQVVINEFEALEAILGEDAGKKIMHHMGMSTENMIERVTKNGTYRS